MKNPSKEELRWVVAYSRWHYKVVTQGLSTLDDDDTVNPTPPPPPPPPPTDD